MNCYKFKVIGISEDGYKNNMDLKIDEVCDVIDGVIYTEKGMVFDLNGAKSRENIKFILNFIGVYIEYLGEDNQADIEDECFILERKRIYHYLNGGKLEFKNVVEVIVSNSGNHRLKLQDGSHWIIKEGWIAIELDIDEWSF